MNAGYILGVVLLSGIVSTGFAFGVTAIRFLASERMKPKSHLILMFLLDFAMIFTISGILWLGRS